MKMRENVLHTRMHRHALCRDYMRMRKNAFCIHVHSSKDAFSAHLQHGAFRRKCIQTDSTRIF